MKTILVFYVGIKDIPPQHIDDVFESISSIQSKLGDDFISFAIPVNSMVDSWIECINPVLLDEEQYKDTKDKLQFIQEQYEKQLKDVQDTKSND
jgi:hypothetical protein